MPSVNDDLLENSISHAIDLQHYSNGEVRRMLVILNKADIQLSEQLVIALQRLPRESFTVQRLDALLVEVNKLNGGTYQSIKKEFGNDLLELTRAEASYQHDLFQSVIPIDVSISKIAPEAVYAAAVARPFQISKDKAIDLSSYLDGLSAARASSIKEAIKLGFITGETTDQIVRRIMGTKSKNYADGLMEGSRQHIEGMVRTSISHMSNFTSERFYEANSGMIKGWQFVATLDGRTTITCASLSGKVFPIGKGPKPPLHIGCRSTTVPVTKSWRELGIDIEEFKSTRASMDGQIAEDISFTQWLRSKPASFQDDILGATRGKLFRANEIEVDKFTNNKGKVYTIEELRRKNKELFEKAGI